MPDIDIRCGDALTLLREMPDEQVQCVVTSPPYWGLRDYGIDGAIGLEKTPEEYVGKLVEVFREVRRVLRQDGVGFINLGDCYAGTGKTGGGEDGKRRGIDGYGAPARHGKGTWEPPPAGLKIKDRVGIPHMVVFALRADGWWWRDEIVWQKPNPMPESVRDRCTCSHEYVFMLTRNARYFYDQDAIREPHTCDRRRGSGPMSPEGAGRNDNQELGDYRDRRVKTATDPGKRRQAPEPGEPGAFHELGRNRRSVWTIPTQPYPEAHFATFPEALVEPCVMAGSDDARCIRAHDTVLDPFCGAGTVGLVCARLGRRFIGLELNEKYCEMARQRIAPEAAQTRLC